VLPDGRFQLIIDLTRGPGIVNGMRSKCMVIDTAAIQTVMGVVFRPGGARPFFDAAADEFSNQTVTLDLVWGFSLRCLLDRLHQAIQPGDKFRVLETALQQRLKTRLELHPAVYYGLHEFLVAPHIRSVLDVTRQAGLSRRRFSQLFREQVGLTPKLYCRLRRFQQVMGQIASGAPVDWADVALAGGYSDQAHLSHEFRDFSGLSPGAYLAAQKPFENHVRMD
jgi:AraC-like DNA-binding protein